MPRTPESAGDGVMRYRAASSVSIIVGRSRGLFVGVGFKVGVEVGGLIVGVLVGGFGVGVGVGV